MTLLARNVGRGAPVGEGFTRVGPVLEQEVDELRVAVLRGTVERREAALAAAVRIGSRLEQDPPALCVTSS